MSDSVLVGVQSALTYIGVLALGAISSHLWGRYRRRLATVRWSANLQPMAFGTDDLGWGRVEILYDGNQTRNIHIATVQLQNASSTDFTDVRVEIDCDQGTVRLRSLGQLRGSAQILPHSRELMAIIQPTPPRQLTQQEIAYWSPRSEFVIPVFNRGAVATFTLLLSRPDHATPTVSLFCVHQGLQLKHRAIEQEVHGVSARTAQKTGLGVAITVALLAALSPVPKWISVTVTLLVASYLVGIGAVVVRMGRKIASLAD